EVPDDRIVAAILRGWPASWGPDPNWWGDAQQNAVFDAMERVRSDLAEDIVSADRWTNVVAALATLAACLALLRIVLLGRRRIWLQFVLLPAVMLLVFLPFAG